MKQGAPTWGSREWFLQEGEPEWRTHDNRRHTIGVVADAHFANDRTPQLTAGPSTVYGTDQPTVNLALDHRLPDHRKQHASDGALGITMTPLAMMGFASELFALAHSQYMIQLALDHELLKS